MADLPSDHEARHILVIGAADGTVALWSTNNVGAVGIQAGATVR
jgi:hypothetical protein